MNEGAKEVTGPIAVIHQFVDMPSQKAEYVDPVTSERVQVSIFRDLISDCRPVLFRESYI